MNQTSHIQLSPIHLLQAIDTAELIFYTFLERYPHNQQKFPAFKDKPLVELKVRNILLLTMMIILIINIEYRPTACTLEQNFQCVYIHY